MGQRPPTPCYFLIGLCRGERSALARSRMKEGGVGHGGLEPYSWGTVIIIESNCIEAWAAHARVTIFAMDTILRSPRPRPPIPLVVPGGSQVAFSYIKTRHAQCRQAELARETDASIHFRERRLWQRNRSRKQERTNLCSLPTHCSCCLLDLSLIALSVITT